MLESSACLVASSPGKTASRLRLLPLQGMILIADPAYNEPNVEQMRATAEGEARSRLYNAEVRTLGFHAFQKHAGDSTLRPALTS